MLIFANPCLGKTTAISKLNLNAFEINNKKIFELIKCDRNKYISECINQLKDAESNRILMSMYFERDVFKFLLNQINNYEILILGIDKDYIETIKNSINIRQIRERKAGYTDSIISDCWAKESTIERNFKEFNFLKENFPNCNYVQLKPAQYLSSVLKDFVPNIHNQNCEKENINNLKKEYPLIF